MEAYYINVIHSDKLNFHNNDYCEKGELSIGTSVRLIHRSDAAKLESLELAEHYKNAIHAKRLKTGDMDFEAKVERVISQDSKFISRVKEDSEIVLSKLGKWKYPTPEQVNLNKGGWIVRVQIEDEEQDLYLK
jgi:hypothetical protein